MCEEEEGGAWLGLESAAEHIGGGGGGAKFSQELK